jgi:hypothetical protein
MKKICFGLGVATKGNLPGFIPKVIFLVIGHKPLRIKIRNNFLSYPNGPFGPLGWMLSPAWKQDVFRMSNSKRWKRLKDSERTDSPLQLCAALVARTKTHSSR